MPTDEYALLLAKIEDDQSKLTKLSAGYEAQTRVAYLQAQDDIQQRITDLVESRGGLAGLSARDRWRITRDTGLLENIDGRLAELGSTHTSIVSQAFQESGALARNHLGDELAAVVAHANLASGIGTPVAAVVDFAKLDTAAIELGLGTAVNDVTALNQATRITMQRELTAGVAAGEGIPKLSRRLSTAMDVSQDRAEIISRWTTIKGYNLAHQATYEAASTQIDGLQKQWMTQTDERACPHCLSLHGVVVEIKDEFDPSGTYASKPIEPYQGFLETPPLHPRCRCTIASWHESWRAYTDSTPQEQHEDARDLAVQQGFPKASTAGVTGVAPTVGIETAAGNALGDIMKGFYMFDDFSGTVRIADVDDLAQARLALRDAGFRVRRVADDDLLLRIDWPRGLVLPRTIRSTKLKALSASRWATIKKGLQACGLS